MCSQETVLETLRKMGDSGLTQPTIMLAEAQAKDYNKMTEKIKNLETKVDNMSSDVKSLKSDMAEIKSILLANKTKLNIDDLLKNKYFWIFATVLVLVLSGATGVLEKIFTFNFSGTF